MALGEAFPPCGEGFFRLHAFSGIQPPAVIVKVEIPDCHGKVPFVFSLTEEGNPPRAVARST